MILKLPLPGNEVIYLNTQYIVGFAPHVDESPVSDALGGEIKVSRTAVWCSNMPPLVLDMSCQELNNMLAEYV